MDSTAVPSERMKLHRGAKKTHWGNEMRLSKKESWCYSKGEVGEGRGAESKLIMNKYSVPWTMLKLKYFALHLHLELIIKTKEKKKQHLHEFQLRDSPGLWHNTIWKVKSPGQETNWT